MILISLKIERERWGDRKGEFSGEAEFMGKSGKVTLNLNEKHIEEIFKTCADSILDTAKKAAHDLTCEVIEHKESLKIEESQNEN